jgi:hypothetical protein
MTELFDPTKAILILAVIVVGCILLFLAFRAIILWYYKIDTRVNNQKAMIHLLTEILKATHENKKVY